MAQLVHAGLSRPVKKRRPTVYAWATGQDDNIGDSLLRRPYMNMLREIGPVVAWIGQASNGFKAGLGMRAEDVALHSFWQWYRAALFSSVRTKTVVAINAGEITVSGKGAARLAALCLVIALAKIRGGGSIWLGAGVPNCRPILVLPYIAAARISEGARWRQPESEVYLRSRGLVPDWAFSLGSSVEDWEPPSVRSKMALILRGDRPRPSREWLHWVGDLARRLDLQPVVVVQVERDAKRAIEVSTELGGIVEKWPDSDHLAQEQRVRTVYADCALAIGDRLHGLIVAASEGAVPLGWVESSKGKIDSHFAVVNLPWVGSMEGSRIIEYPPVELQQVLEWQEELEGSISEARKQWDDVRKAAVAKYI